MCLPCQLTDRIKLLFLILFLLSRCLCYSFCHDCIHNAQEGKCTCHKGKDINEPGGCCLCRIEHRRTMKLLGIGPVHGPGKDSAHQYEQPVLPDSLVGAVLAI